MICSVSRIAQARRVGIRSNVETTAVILEFLEWLPRCTDVDSNHGCDSGQVTVWAAWYYLQAHQKHIFSHLEYRFPLLLKSRAFP